MDDNFFRRPFTLRAPFAYVRERPNLTSSLYRAAQLKDKIELKSFA